MEIDSKQNLLDRISGDHLKDKAYGMIFGAMIGDSLGSYNEFQNRFSTDEEI